MSKKMLARLRVILAILSATSRKASNTSSDADYAARPKTLAKVDVRAPVCLLTSLIETIIHGKLDALT
jgi:hypothetical protein